MVSIASVVEKIVKKSNFIELALLKGIINFSAYAKLIKPVVEKELKKKVQIPSIVMALRRLAKNLPESITNEISFDKGSDITIKSDLCEVTFVRSEQLLEKLPKLYQIADLKKGDFLTITHGVYEVTIIFNSRYKKNFLQLFKEEKPLKIFDNLASLTVKLPLSSLHTPGFFYFLIKVLTWEEINIIEIVSTLTELTFILKQEDVTKVFNILRELIDKRKTI